MPAINQAAMVAVPLINLTNATLPGRSFLKKLWNDLKLIRNAKRLEERESFLSMAEACKRNLINRPSHRISCFTEVFNFSPDTQKIGY